MRKRIINLKGNYLFSCLKRGENVHVDENHSLIPENILFMINSQESSDYEGLWHFQDWKDFCENKINSVRRYRQSQEPVILNELFTPISGDLILDAGIGYGRLSRLIYHKDIHVVGVDISLSMIHYCRNALAQDVVLIMADIKHLPFRSGIFSKVLCNGVLVHNKDVKMIIAELCRVLKPGGTIVISGNNLLSPWTWLPCIIALIRYKILSSRIIMFYRTPFFYKRVLRKNRCLTSRVASDTLAAVDLYNKKTHKTITPTWWLYVAKLVDKLKDIYPLNYLGWEVWYQAIKQWD